MFYTHQKMDFSQVRDGHAGPSGVQLSYISQMSQSRRSVLACIANDIEKEEAYMEHITVEERLASTFLESMRDVYAGAKNA